VHPLLATFQVTSFFSFINREASNMDSTEGRPKLMPLHLLEELTAGFSKNRILGGGAYGEVYLV
jgi:hypothetical protein